MTRYATCRLCRARLVYRRSRFAWAHVRTPGVPHPPVPDMSTVVDDA